MHQRLLLSLIALVICEGELAGVTTNSLYRLCPQGLISSASGTAYGGRSKIDCLNLCSKTIGCTGINVCPNGGGGTQCTLLSGQNAGTCAGLVGGGSGNCLYAQKEQTVPVGCQNGGTLQQNGTCVCAVGFRGQHYCSEAFDLGARVQSLDGVYVIQPTMSSSPFEVYCFFSQWSGETVLLWRQAAPPQTCSVGWNSWPWSQYVSGFGTAACKNFFIGLEKTRLIVSQANYLLEILHIYNNYGSSKSAYYTDFTLSSNNNYTLKYSSCDVGSADNGMAALPPRDFCAADFCPNVCYATKGAPGWYGSGCSGYSTFATALTWPVAGVAVSCNEAVYTVARQGGYY